MWRRATLLAAVLGIAACALSTPVTRLSVAGGTVTVSAPNGYCIHRGSTRDTSQGTFVLLGSCAAMTSDGVAAPVPVVLTALVSDPLQTEKAPDSATLSQYFRSSSGRAVLSRSGQAQSVSVLHSETRRGVLYMKTRDLSPQEDEALTQDTWRAFLPISDRVVVLSVKTLATQPVSSDAALGVLRDFVGAVQAANQPKAPA